jgi:hypothetical protein
MTTMMRHEINEKYLIFNEHLMKFQRVSGKNTKIQCLNFERVCNRDIEMRVGKFIEWSEKLQGRQKHTQSHS